MEIHYKHDYEDLLIFNEHFCKSSKSTRKLIIQGIVTWLLVMFALCMLYGYLLHSLIAGWIGFIVFCVLYLCFFRRTFRTRISKMLEAGSNKTFLAETTLTVVDSGITISNQYFRSTLFWSGIDRLEEDGRSLYLFAYSISAHIIPKRAFSTQDDIDRFKSIIHGNIDSEATADS